MSGHRRRGIPLCLVALALFLSGCAVIRGDRKPAVPDTQPLPRAASPSPVQTQLPSKPPVQTPAVHKPSKSPPPEPAQPAPSPKQHIEAGEYQKALEEYDVSYRKHPREQALTAEYAKGVEEMRSAADKACDDQEFTAAGRTYDLLFKHYAQFKDFAHLLTFNRTYLDQKLSLCKKSLSVLGFKEYRKGNLGEAIVMWRGLLAIDPNNEDIRKAMNTATEQQKNLQKRK
jgi:tetratricopeptide (TPR) repeat protein